MRLKEKIRNVIENHPIWLGVIPTILVTIVIGILNGGIYSLFTLWHIDLCFFAVPIVLSAINIVTLVAMVQSKKFIRTTRVYEYLTLIVGTIYTILYMGVLEIMLGASWSKQLVNSEKHPPIWNEDISFYLLCVLGFVGYIVLSCKKADKTPPLVTCLSLSAMYLGAVECIIWCVQTSYTEFWLLWVLPINYLIIVVKMVRIKILEYQSRQEEAELYEGNKFLEFADRQLRNAYHWPVIAFILMIPLLAILIVILILFGQRPDTVIKAWTETAEWRLSMREAPQNIYEDQHYLCTVAAGGHRKVVKPVRLGVRHGHRVIVNRQLMIANAFEQILEERTPRFHKFIRGVYDKYGFPVAKLIKSKWIADVIYIVMKPFEWMFLLVIYLCDVKPENRIVVQYLPKKRKK